MRLLSAVRTRRHTREIHPSRNSGQGFTLVEIMVVLIVLGIAAGLIYARIDIDPREKLDREGARLAAALEHAAQLAQWRSETIAFAADARGYRFLKRTDNAQWAMISDDDVLRERLLPAPMAVVPLAYSGRRVPPDALVPLRASGRNEPYTIELMLGPRHMLLAADPLNRVQRSLAAAD